MYINIGIRRSPVKYLIVSENVKLFLNLSDHAGKMPIAKVKGPLNSNWFDNTAQFLFLHNQFSKLAVTFHIM